MASAVRRAIAVALLAALVLPAAAPGRATVIAGPMKVRAYDMLLVGVDARRDTFTVSFTRRRGRSVQQHQYLFTRGVDVTPTSISGSLGRYGAVDLERAGRRMTGSFRLVADATYFRTVTADALPVPRRGTGPIRGSSEGGGDDGPTLEMTARDADGTTAFTAAPNLQLAMRMEREQATAPATIVHLVAARAGGLDVTGPDAATVDGAEPWLLGRGILEGRTFSGNLFADFDSIGAVPLEGRATLKRGG